MRVIVKMIVMVIIRVKIVYIGVLMRLVSITPPKVDRVNDNNSENNNE
jgi:hypothetical protein